MDRLESAPATSSPSAEPGCAIADVRRALAARFTIRSMTRCECADVSFAEIARRVDEGAPLQKVMKATGCGGTCTACVPDLERFLGDR